MVVTAPDAGELLWNSVNGAEVPCAKNIVTIGASSVVSVIVAVMEGSVPLKKANVDYVLVRGEIWQRLIVIKDRRTHRKRVPQSCAATIKVGTTKYVIPTEVTSEGAVLLKMSANNTEWLAEGTYEWDLVATVSRSALLLTPISSDGIDATADDDLSEMLIAQGTIEVVNYENLTPMDSDGNPTALEVVS